MVSGYSEMRGSKDSTILTAFVTIHVNEYMGFCTPSRESSSSGLSMYFLTVPIKSLSKTSGSNMSSALPLIQPTSVMSDPPKMRLVILLVALS